MILEYCNQKSHSLAGEAQQAKRKSAFRKMFLLLQGLYNAPALPSPVFSSRVWACLLVSRDAANEGKEGKGETQRGRGREREREEKTSMGRVGTTQSTNLNKARDWTSPGSQRASRNQWACLPAHAPSFRPPGLNRATSLAVPFTFKLVQRRPGQSPYLAKVRIALCISVISPFPPSTVK